MVASVHDSEPEARAAQAAQNEKRGHLWHFVVREARRA